MMKSRIKAQNLNAQMGTYETARRDFSWEKEQASFDHIGGEGINIVHEAIDCRARAAGDARALVLEKNGKVYSHTYADLRRLSCKWANVLAKLGFSRGDRLFVYMGPTPELYFAFLACARMGVVCCPLFPSLLIDELEDRLRNAKPKAILTNHELLENLPHDAITDVEHILLTEGPAPGIWSNELVIKEMTEQASDVFDPVWLEPDAPLYMLYTSGSTGPPKGVVHCHGDMVGMRATARMVLDLFPGTVLWADAQPAWVTGTVYGAFAPWLCGAVSVVMADRFSASSWYRTIEKHRVEVWYTTPSVLRRLMDEGEDLSRRYDLSSLRLISSVGEALGPDIYHWAKTNLGLPVHDTWWMTETGVICVANYPSMDTKPGSMGKPVPGVHAAVVSDDGTPLPMLTLGQLALKPEWPGLMREIWRDSFRFKEYFRLPGWFLTGDMALVDEEGYFFHQGRMDDLVKIDEKLVGPYEIERALCRHPAVHDAAVILKETAPGRSALKAFLRVTEGFKANPRLVHELKTYVKSNLSAAVALNEIEFMDELPKTRSGKVLRRVLRARELGLPEGDLRLWRDEPPVGGGA
jgi:acetyl-CoA synthetase